jgi:hypothetical protein
MIATYLKTTGLQNKRAETGWSWDETGWAGDEGKFQREVAAYY